jgi:hypothetical protein
LRVQRRKRLSGFVLYAAILSAIAAWFAFFMPARFVSSEALNSAPDLIDHDSHSGTIILRAGGEGCRRLSFDNGTGALQDGGVGKCVDTNPSANSTEARMRGVRDAFRR